MSDGNRPGMTPEQYERMMAAMRNNSVDSPMGGQGNRAPAQQPAVNSTGVINGNVPYTPEQRPQQFGQPQQPQMQSMSMPSQGMENQRVSAQEALRNRMKAERSNGSSPQATTMSQTRDYQPNNMQAVNTQQTFNTQTTNVGQVNPQQSTSTIINTTQQDGIQQGGDEAGSGGKFKWSKNVVFIVVAAVMALLLLAYLLFGGNDGDSEEDDIPDPFTDDTLEWLDPVGVETFLYTPQEIDALRTAGYTGTEIEEYQSAGTSAQSLIDIAEAKRDAWIKDAISPLYDMASDEYKYQISQTWLTLPQRTDATEWTMIGSMYTERKNLDYEKIDVYGNQLFIKVYLDDNTHEDWFFLCVTPEEWNALSDRGNVIVSYTYWTHLVGDDYFSSVEDTSNIYITQASLEIIK